ncbi:MAG: hypothetical protein JOZ19_14050 [Rubrobacter sp.]|nr:hypothetical protein [Rubrobacter sp.]
MSDEPKGQADKRDIITPAERRNIWIWAILLVVLLTTTGGFLIWEAYQIKAASAQEHDDTMNPNLGEGGTRPPPTELPAGANPLRVDGGIYLDRIPALSVKDSSWTADFYVWFRWRGEQGDPGEDFQVVDGWIDSKEKVDEYTSGDEHYKLYRVIANITKWFNVGRFPRDDHLLTINIESREPERDQLLFVPDSKSSGVSSRVENPIYSVYNWGVLEKPHAYQTTLGDPRVAADTEHVHSQLRMGLFLQSPGWGFYLKMFLALFASVVVALFALFFDPMYATGAYPRFGIGIGALFAAVANTYVISSLVPPTGLVTMADEVSQLGIAMIGLSLIQSMMSLYLAQYKRKKELSRLFDRVTFVILLIGYVVINLALPLAASL